MTVKLLTRFSRRAEADAAAESAPTNEMVKVSERVFAGPAPSVPEIYWLAEEGFRSLIRLRIAGTPEPAPSVEEERRQAEAAGLAYCDIPIAERESPGEAEAAAILVRVIDIFPGPAYVRCAAAGRAIALSRLAEARAVAAGERAGDIRELIGRLSTDDALPERD